MTGCFGDFGTARRMMVVWPSEVPRLKIVLPHGIRLLTFAMVLLLLLLLLFNTMWYRFNGFLYSGLQRASISAKGPFWCLDRGVHLFIIKIIGHLYSLPFFATFDDSANMRSM